MSTKLSGRNFDITLLGIMVMVKSASVTINDESAVDKQRGVVNGHTDGAATCDVEYELDLNEFKKLTVAARAAGSWRGIKPHNALFYANNGEMADKIELFGVKLVLSDILSVDPDSSDKTTRKIKGFVTDPKFVEINGISYLSDYDTRGLF